LPSAKCRLQGTTVCRKGLALHQPHTPSHPFARQLGSHPSPSRNSGYAARFSVSIEPNAPGGSRCRSSRERIGCIRQNLRSVGPRGVYRCLARLRLVLRKGWLAERRSPSRVPSPPLRSADGFVGLRRESLLREMRRCDGRSSWSGHGVGAAQERAGSPLKCGHAKGLLMIRIGLCTLLTSCGAVVDASQVCKGTVRIAFVKVPASLFITSK
jgi:hypothetical protein